MKKSSMVSVLASSLFCTSLAFGQVGKPAGETPQIAARILLDTKKTQLSGGEEVVLDVTIENTGQKPLYFHYRDFEFFYQVDVLMSDRKINPLPGYKAHPKTNFFSQGITIPPHGRKTGDLYLNQAFDLSQKGMYKVVVSKGSNQEGGPFTVTSQPLSIEITSPLENGDWDDEQ